MNVALVLGGAARVWADVAEASEFGPYAGVVACNHLGIAYPAVLDAWASLHPEDFGVWTAMRARKALPPHKALYGQHGSAHTTEKADVRYTDLCLPGQRTNGSSGLFAAKVALIDLGFDRVVFCGVPMDDEPHFHGEHGFPHAPKHRPGWFEALPYLADRARSMGGWSAELLGRPNADWLTE
jgi:hypothetical protein